MGKQTNRIEQRAGAAHFDQEAVREAVLRGDPPNEIAMRFGGKANSGAVSSYISYHRQAWLDEARYSRIQADHRKIVLPRKVTDRAGGSYIMPISLPRNSMYLAALVEAAQ
jgi:hypothetical protein